MLYTCYRATNFAFVCVCVEREEKALPRKGVPQGMPRKGVQKRCALSCAKGVKKMTLRCRPKQRTFGRQVMRFACNAPQKSPVVFLKRALFAAQKSPVWGLKLLVYESWSYQCSNDPGLFCATHSALMLSWALKDTGLFSARLFASTCGAKTSDAQHANDKSEQYTHTTTH